MAAPATTEAKSSTNLPFNKPVSLQSLEAGGATYSTVQTLAQHVAYTFSDKIFTYSPETFDLDVAVRQWSAEQHNNAFGFVPGVNVQETRVGSGNIALGYVFSPDFDLKKRHIPQSIIANSGSLLVLRESLNQLSLLHALANPFVAHVAAVDYNAEKGLVSDYLSAQEIADDLGFGLVSSSSAQDAQHTALLATVLAKLLPTINVYDGALSRNTTLINKISGQNELAAAYQQIIEQLSGTETKHSDNEGKALRALNAFNAVLGTKYQPFEYRGHPQAEKILVTFGSTEAALSETLVNSLVTAGHKIGVVNVRIYRPFIEEEFIRVLPKSTQAVHVLGQVDNELKVEDVDSHSQLYQDVFTALTFTGPIAVTDVKYAKQQAWERATFLPIFEKILGLELSETLNVADANITQVSVWTLDESSISKSNAATAALLSRSAGDRVYVRDRQDNLVQGGVTRSDISIASGNVDETTAPFFANVAFVGSDKLLGEYDIINSIRIGGTLIVGLPGVKNEDLEKKIPEQVRNQIKAWSIRLVVLDTAASPTVAANASLESALVQLAISQVLSSDYVPVAIQNIAENLTDKKDLPKLQYDLPLAVREVEIPETWSETSEDAKKLSLKADVSQNSFAPFDRAEENESSLISEWTIAARGVVFKEAYGSKTLLRPDAGVKTAVVHVKERRRLTPLSYDRNIFHIEFDLGDSGLTYKIGEALGIHAENYEDDVNAFIKWYGLNAGEVVQVPSREDPNILENRTVFQALKQNVDIFGKPPKRFYETLADYATNPEDKKNLLTLATPDGATEFKRRSEVDTITFADVLAEFPSAKPSFDNLVRIVSPLKRREYSIASSQHVTPTTVALLIVTVNWVDPTGRDRFGLATRFLNDLKVGAPLTVSVKPSVMKLPPKSTSPIIMAGLGTGLAPFRAFVQERAYQKQVLGQEIGSVLLYLGSRHQREEYLYGEEWEAYRDAGIVTLIGAAFSRDQPQKIYIQDRMRQTQKDIRKAYFEEEGAFYLCGPTWPVPDVTEVLQEAVVTELKEGGAKKVDGRREIETLKEAGRFVLEVY